MLRKTILRQAGNLLRTGFLFASAVRPASAVSLQWAKQLGTSSDEAAGGVSADGMGNAYTIGSTKGSLGGTNAGARDAFVAKYDAAGNLQWTRQLGTSSDDFCFGVSADGGGTIYISGNTTGSLGGTNAGGNDAFVTKYDAAGGLQWTRQLGTTSDEWCQSVSADGMGNAYISGYTSGSLGGPRAGALDAFLAKYDAAGNLQWTKQLGTSADDVSNGVSADGLGNVYISGSTFGSLGGPNAGARDAFVSKYDAAGNLQWTKQLGTSSTEISNGVSADRLGNVYISGLAFGSLGGPNAGGYDGFVAKYDAAGNLQWTRQFGTSLYDDSAGVSTDGLGNVYISGTIGSSAFVAKYDAFGDVQWTPQLGSRSQGSGVSGDGLGNVYIAGSTPDSLGGTNAGSQDALVAKYSDSSALLGDINLDGKVDAADYVVWRKTRGTAADYNSWRQNFGATAAGAAAAAHSDFGTVPEPRGLTVYWSALVALFGLRGVTGRKRCTDSRNFDKSLSCAVEISSGLWLRLRLSG